jgi:hypothetical protein
MKKIYTVRDARRAKELRDSFLIAAEKKATELRSAEQELLQENPQIGVLCREGKTVYYVYPVNGVYRESSDLSHLVSQIN